MRLFSMDEVPQLAGDALDVRSLQAWAASQRCVAEEVKQSLVSPSQLEVPRAPCAPAQRSDFPGNPGNPRNPSASAMAVARLACAMSKSAEELQQRWREDQEKLAHALGIEEQVRRLGDELSRARAARITAHRRLQDLKDRKQAAQAALGKAMEMEEETEDEELEDSQSVAPSEPHSDGEEQVKKRGWSGAKRMFGKGLKKMRGGRKPKPESLTPPSATSPVSSVASHPRTLSPSQSQRPPTPKQVMVQASSDELVHTAEAIQLAAEEFDTQTSKCEEVAEALANCICSGAANVNAREAVRDGACALEEWADEVRASLTSTRWDTHSLETTSVGDPCSSSGSDHEEADAQPSSDIVNDADHSHDLLSLGQMKLESEVLLRRLPPRFVAQHVCREILRPGKGSQDPDESSPDVSEDERPKKLQCLVQHNDDLEKSFDQTRPAFLVRQMKHSCASLNREAARLESLAASAASASAIAWQTDSASSSPCKKAVSEVSGASPRIGRSMSVGGLARGARSRSSSKASSPAKAELSRSGSRPTTPRQDAPASKPAGAVLYRPPALGNARDDGSSEDSPTQGERPLSPSFGGSLRGAAAKVEQGRNPFGAGEFNPFPDDTPGGAEARDFNPFDVEDGADSNMARGNPFSMKSEEEENTNPFAQADAAGGATNPFANDEAGVSSAESSSSNEWEDAEGNPFAVDRHHDRGVSEVLEDEPQRPKPCLGSPASLLEEAHTATEVFQSPASFAEGPAPRSALVSRPICLEAVKTDSCASAPSSPRVTSLMPGAASSLEMWRRPSPRQLPGGLAGCLCNVRSSVNTGDLDEELKHVIGSPSLEAAIAASDAAMCRGRLEADLRSWQWRDHAAEEGHQVLQNSTHSLSDMLTDEDWGYFSYELLLLSRAFLSEGSVALDQVSALIPICRVRLGINGQLHNHIVELSKPAGSEAFSPLDVRYRATLLLRLWSSWEAFDYGTLADTSKDWTQRWICTQLRVLKGSVMERAMQLHAEGQEDLSACGRCFRAIRELTEAALSGTWGKPLPFERIGEPSGRRLLTILFKELDALKPSASWSFNVVFAARVFGTLWRAATDGEAEDRLSLDAPLVAAALLSCLHPHMAPLQLETHALLFVQQLWSATFSPSTLQLPSKALAVSANILTDFSHWLQGQAVDAASCFARQGARDSSQQPLELIARRLLTVDLRDQLVQTLTDYRRHFEPAAFGPALQLWERCFRETRRSDVGRGRSNEDLADTAEFEDQARVQTWKGESGSTEELFRQFGQWFVWKSASKEAELALQPYDEPPQVPMGDEMAWKRLGPKIKKFLEGLTDAVQSLIEELECEKTFYNEAWVAHGLGSEHLSFASAAVVAAVRPRVEKLKAGVWPTGPPILEVPPGGGRLIQVLEALDREASRHRGAQVPPSEPLVDILVPHVTSALAESLATLDRDITSKALDGHPDTVFVPLRPPTSIYCQAVVTLWRFIHDALDAPLSLGIPVDIVVSPFINDFLGQVLQRSAERLVRPCEDAEAFRMSTRAAQVAWELKNTNCAVDSDEDESLARKADDTKRSRGRGRKKFLTKLSGKTFPEENKNAVLEARLLEVNPEVVLPPVRQVMVRLSSIGFCLTQLADVHTKLFKTVNSGDDDGVPTARHNEARVLIVQELPELQEGLLQQGQKLAKYLAARLVYHELRAELFEKLYFVAAVPGGGTPTPSSAVGSFTPRTSTTPASFLETGAAASTLTLKEIVASRQNSFLSLVEQAPTSLLGSFVADLGIELTRAWMYVIVDYLSKQQLDQIYDHLDSDQDALSRAIDSMMQVTRKRVQTQALGGLTHEDCRDAEKRLEEVQRLSQCLIEEIRSRTADELARYAGKIRGELAQAETHDGVSSAVLGRERSQTPTPAGRSKSPHPRSASPSGASAGPFGAFSPRSPSPAPPISPRDPEDPHASSGTRSAKHLFQRAWKATKRLGKGNKESDTRDTRQ